MARLPRYLVAGAAGLLLAGCAASWATSESWSKSGSTQEAAAESLRLCTEQADVALRAPVGGGATRVADGRANDIEQGDGENPNESPSARRDRLIGRCMIMRGYLIER